MYILTSVKLTVVCVIAEETIPEPMLKARPGSRKNVGNGEKSA